jgi:hypothetical protein
MSTRRTSHRFQEKGAKKFTSDSEGHGGQHHQNFANMPQE